MNNDQEIILAKISAVYDKPPFVKMETGQMEMILKCVGLGAYYDKYREYLEPYWYNGRFQNPVESYRIFVGLNSIFEDLLNERKGDEIISLLTELGNYIPGTILSDEARFAADFNKLRQLYNLMGLQIVSMEVDEYSSKFQVEPYLNEGNQIIQSFGMERWLKSKYQDVYEAYESALNSFSSGDLGAAIESCRTALTGIFSKYKGVPFQKAKWMLGMATLTGDFTGTQSVDASEMTSIKNEIEAMGKRDIADFFEENLEGSYKKTKAIYSIYSMLSDYGTHRLEGTVEVAKNEDETSLLKKNLCTLMIPNNTKGNDLMQFLDDSIVIEMHPAEEAFAGGISFQKAFEWNETSRGFREVYKRDGYVVAMKKYGTPHVVRYKLETIPRVLKRVLKR